MSRIIRLACALTALVVASTASAQTLSAWPKWHLDDANTGWNQQEGQLTAANVNTATFGKVWDSAVDGQVYAEPLYVAKVRMGRGQTASLVVVATEHDSVYALDAATGATVWHASLGTSVPSGVVGCGDLTPEYGITSTPYIDTNPGIVYVVTKTLESGVQTYRLHALDLATGAERTGWGFVISGTFVVGGGTPVTFNPNIQLQRCGLVVIAHTIYVTFGSHCDIQLNQYHGWMFGFDTRRPGTPTAVWNSTPDSSGLNEAAGGIWMSGASPSVDGHDNLYVMTGNAPFDVDLGGYDAGDSFVKLGTRRGREITFSRLPEDYFCPSNQAFLDAVDADLGSGGTVVLPTQPNTVTPDILVGGGKDALLRVLDRNAMGGFTGRLDQNAPNDVLQEVGGFAGGFWSSPAYAETASGRFVYINAIFDSLKQYSVGTDVNGRVQLTLAAVSPVGSSYPSMTPVISSSGLGAGTGVVWGLSRSTNALHAVDASNVGVELWSSNMSGGADTFGTVIKFSVPTVANGRVFVGADGRVAAFGLR
jgi:outer membrane protein assembly factor BamB